MLHRRLGAQATKSSIIKHEIQRTTFVVHILYLDIFTYNDIIAYTIKIHVIKKHCNK